MIRAGLACVLGLAAALTAAGAARVQADTAPATGVLAKNLADETCHWASSAAEPAVQAASKPRSIVCGSKEQPAANLWSTRLAEPLPSDPAARRDLILRVGKSTPAGLSIGMRMSCDPGQWLEASDAVLFSCSLKTDGWPSIVLAAVAGTTIYQAEGLPAMLPVLQAAIADASGRPLNAAETEAAAKLLEARLPHDLLRASGADFANYKDFIELARLYSGARNYAGAEAAHRHALVIETRLFGANSEPVGETLAEIALQVSNQGRFDEAAGLFRRAEPIVEASSNLTARARLYSYLALDAANQRHFADALKFGQRATAMRRAQVDAAAAEHGGLDPLAAASRGELAHSLRIEAEMDLRLNNLPAARAAAVEALQIVTAEPRVPLWWRPEVAALVAEINAREGRVVEAEREYREAIELQQKLFGDTAPAALTELRLGRFYTEQQLYPAAVATFRTALAILAKDDVARADITADQIVPFIAAASAMAAADAKQTAALDADVLRASQLINSSVADQTIARAAARLATDNSAIGDLVRALQQAEQQRDSVRVELAAETAKSDDTRDAARERKLGDDLRAASANADAVSARLLASFPDYARLAEPGPAELGALQAALQPSEAFLSFVIGEEAGYALLVTRDRMTMTKIDIDAPTLADDVTDLRKAFVPRLGGLQSFDLRASFALYRRLIAPLDADLKGVNDLVVAQSGALASLPLALLVTAEPAAGHEHSYTDAAWLVRRLALSEVPSARAFLSLRAAEQHRVPAPRPFLGIGNPSFTGAGAAGGTALDALAGGCRESGPIAPELLRALPPLPETANEVEAVARLEGADSGSVLLGAAASEGNLRAHPLDQYAVLYFATHALLPGELRCQSEPALVLSPPPQRAATTEEDGLLEASEIGELKLNADLVVLSACNTAAAGGGFGGEALAGLADAFFNAGARTIVASHWEVPSAGTVTLMTGVFQRFGPDRASGLAEALRQSQLARIADPATAHPFYWAAFTVIGEGAATSRTAGGSVPPAGEQLSKGRS